MSSKLDVRTTICFSSDEKKALEKIAQKEKLAGTSELVRRVMSEYIKKQEQEKWYNNWFAKLQELDKEEPEELEKLIDFANQIRGR